MKCVFASNSQLIFLCMCVFELMWCECMYMYLLTSGSEIQIRIYSMKSSLLQATRDIPKATNILKPNLFFSSGFAVAVCSDVLIVFNFMIFFIKKLLISNLPYVFPLLFFNPCHFFTFPYFMIMSQE